MKVKTKVKAGPRDCGGGSIGGGRLPVGADIPQSEVQSAHLGAPPSIMKVKTQVRTGRGCRNRAKSWPCAALRSIPQRDNDFEIRCAFCAPS